MGIAAVLLCLFLAVYQVHSQRDKQLYCSVCRAVVDEISWQISQVDPKKTVKMGSFRVDPKGNQARKEVPYARSDAHLSEVFEEMCQGMSKYQQTADDNGKTIVVRTYSRSGRPLKFKNFSVNREKSKQLQSYCDSLMEEHEEEMVGLFKRESQPSMDRIICGEISSACTEAQLNEPLPEAERAEGEVDEEDDGDDDVDDEEEEEEDEEEVPEPDVKEEL